MFQLKQEYFNHYVSILYIIYISCLRYYRFLSELIILFKICLEAEGSEKGF